MPVLPAASGELEPLAADAVVLAMLGFLPIELRREPPIRWAYAHFARVTDMAIREYESAREQFEVWDPAQAQKIGDVPDSDRQRAVAGVMQGLLIGDGHLETCVEALHRALVALKLLQSKGVGRGVDMPNADAANRLRDIRDAVQHAGDRLIGRLNPGRRAFDVENLDPYTLSPREHDFFIGSEKPVTYRELVDLMETCHRAVDRIGRTGAGNAPDS